MNNVIKFGIPSKRKEDIEYISVGCYPRNKDSNLLILKIGVQTEKDDYSKDVAVSKEEIELSDYRIIDFIFDNIKREIKECLIARAKTDNNPMHRK